ncbi:amidohydrolase family protein [Parafrigoribacterium mesophilum]|uniref:amidohydrolase family protein n=1 Tax=Parafrigoribacterium mesophilum TaxID=433646 RepID=UPI0031FC4A01
MYSPDLETEYVLTGAHVVADEELRLLSPGYLHIRDGMIVDVGEGTPPSQRDGDPVRVYNLRGHLIMPGLINCHTHIGDTVVKELGYGVPSDVNLLWQPDGLRHVRMGALDREERVVGIRRALRRALATGTVALADFREGGVDGVLELREAAADLPIRCLAFARLTTFPLHDDASLQRNTVGLSDAQLAEVDAGLEVAEGFSPLWANDTTDLGLTQIAQRVRARGKLLATHAGETPQYRELSASRTGQGDVQRIVQFLSPDFVVHMTSATDDELELAAAAGIPLVMCARTQAALGYGIPPFVRATQRGAIVGLGTDNAMISSPDLLAELEFMSRSLRSATGDPAAIDARALLASVTIDAARTLKLDNELGSLSIGKSASLVVIDMESDNLAGSVNPIASLVDRASPTDLKTVLVDGKLAYGDLPVQTG